MVALMAGTEQWADGLTSSLAEIRHLTKEIRKVWIYTQPWIKKGI